MNSIQREKTLFSYVSPVIYSNPGLNIITIILSFIEKKDGAKIK